MGVYGGNTALLCAQTLEVGAGMRREPSACFEGASVVRFEVWRDAGSASGTTGIAAVSSFVGKLMPALLSWFLLVGLLISTLQGAQERQHAHQKMKAKQKLRAYSPAPRNLPNFNPYSFQHSPKAHSTYTDP